MDGYKLAFEQALDDAIEEAGEYLMNVDIIDVLEAKLAELKKDRLDA